MKVTDVVFVGFHSRVVALNRDTGETVWTWKSRQGSGYVAVLVDGDMLIVSVSGYTYGLDALTGQERWFNPLAGMGTGVPCLASSNGTVTTGWLQAVAEEIAAQQAASTAAAAHVP